MAISMRLNTRQGTAVATATRLPRYARNDKVGTRENRTPSCAGNGATKFGSHDVPENVDGVL